MNNVIFGSGIVGLMAKVLLPDWKIVPFAKSRFFTFNPALDDNFVICDGEIDGAVKDLTASPTIQTFLYQRAFDVGGHIFTKYDDGLCQDWLQKFFGTQQPPQATPYLRDRLNLMVYDLRVNKLYESLLNRFMPEIQREHGLGKVTEIGDHYFVRNGIREEFDNAISTIPLNVLFGLMKYASVLETKPVHFLHVETPNLDFEGCNQLWVVDRQLAFYKVVNVARNRYLFYCHEEIQRPGQYLMALMRDFEILDGTSVSDYTTVGPAPQLDWLENKGLYCIGSYAQWDWCMDVGSCLLRTIRYAGRGFKPFRPVAIRPA